jgi:hypothetical protein
LVKIALFTIQTTYLCEQSATDDKYTIVKSNKIFI